MNIQTSLAPPHQDIDVPGSFPCLLDQSQPPRFLKVITLLTLGKSVVTFLCFHTLQPACTNTHYSSVLIALGHNVSRVAHNTFFCVWLLLLSGAMHVVSSFLDGMPLGEYILSRLFIPLLMDTWVVRDTGAISNAAAVDILGQASHCTCETHFCWGYSKCNC